MYPNILVSNNTEYIQKYLEEFKKQEGFSELQVQYISPEKTSISIGQIRELRKELSIATSKPRLIIFNSFDSAKLEAQNALLKVLEEYNSNNQFFMIVQQISNILPTIISRSRVIQLEQDKTVINEDTSKIINEFLKKPTISYLSHPVFTVSSKEEAGILIRIMLQLMREQMHTSSLSFVESIKSAFNLLYKLEHNNLSPQLTVDRLLISIIKVKK